MKSIFSNLSNVAYVAVAFMIGCVLAARAGSSKNEPVTNEESWGGFTNELGAGMAWWSSDKETLKHVTIAIKTSKTNGTIVCFVPPECKLAKAELRDAHGILIVPDKGMRLDGDLPQQILAKDIPRYPTDPDPRGGRGVGGLFKGQLVLDANHLAVPWGFAMQDIYHIEKEGDYTFTIGVAVYRYTHDKHSVVRMDLPPVTVKMHLTASRK